MKIFLLSQNVNKGYDTYDSVVVIAANESEARKINPGGYRRWHDGLNCWMFEYSTGRPPTQDTDDTWVDDLSLITVKEIGSANLDSIPGVVCASFNAG